MSTGDSSSFADFMDHGSLVEPDEIELDFNQKSEIERDGFSSVNECDASDAAVDSDARFSL
jgi:hypothetical protein